MRPSLASVRRLLVEPWCMGVQRTSCRVALHSDELPLRGCVSSPSSTPGYPPSLPLVARAGQLILLMLHCACTPEA